PILQPQGGVGLGFQVGGQRGRDPTQLPGHPVTIVHARCRPRPPVIDPIKGLGPGIEQPSKGTPDRRWQPTETLDDGQQASGHHIAEHHVKQQFFVGPARAGASVAQLGVTSQRKEGFQIVTGVQISNGDLSTVYHGDLLRSGAGLARLVLLLWTAFRPPATTSSIPTQMHPGADPPEALSVFSFDQASGQGWKQDVGKRHEMTDWLERWQITLYLLALGAGALIGLTIPSAAPVFEMAINPVLMVLLYATFLSVPLTKLGHALRDIRFLAGLLVLNFVLVPIVVYGLSRFVADDQALLLGVLLVLLTPCIDYVIVFSGLAGAAHDRLLAAAPLLMVLQMLLLPVYLGLFVGTDLLEVIDGGPFLEALVLLIITPLGAAALTHYGATRWAGP